MTQKAARQLTVNKVLAENGNRAEKAVSVKCRLQTTDYKPGVKADLHCS